MDHHLPVMEIIPEVKELLGKKNTLILQAPPGAGKSTVLPLELLNEPWLNGKKIIMLEPRRLAARSVAIRMAAQLGEHNGETIGYRVRFENKTSPSTKLEVVTEGILTRKLQNDNTLEDVGMVIFDEFHERSLHADLAFTLCREIQQILREDLRILIMSATLNMDQLSNALPDTPTVHSKGRQFPVRIEYLPQETNQSIATQMANAVKKIISKEEGDILAFLPGASEINQTIELLNIPNIKVLPLYGDLPFQKQQEAINPNLEGLRKVILATSIAETSLTIEGIKVVVDSGLSRSPRFNPVTGFTRLETVPVTLDAADQRAGRAGRTSPGVCYRLWHKASTQHLLPNRKPEILEADLASMMLELTLWGVQDVHKLSWITPPPTGAVNQALDLLIKLKAIKSGKITEHGKSIANLPTHPRIAHMLIEAESHDLLVLATDLAAILEERDPLGWGHGAAIADRLQALRQFRENELRENRRAFERIEKLAFPWRKIFKTPVDNDDASVEDIGFLLAAAWPERIAKQQTNDPCKFKLSSGRVAKLPDHDPLVIEKWLVIAQLDAGINEGKIFLASPINPASLENFITEKEVLSWDKQNETLIARKERRIGEIIVETSPLNHYPQEEKIKVLCQAVQADGERLLPWDQKEVAMFQARVQCLRIWRPEEGWPDISTKTLINNPEPWLGIYLGDVKKKTDFQRLDLLTILQGIIPWELSQKIDTLAPSKLQVPTGSMLQLTYQQDGAPPILAVRLQEMFGQAETPAINEGQTKVLLHLLSPGYKPVQVTQDLKSFWNNTYPEVRKELRVRYKKHYWPENPWEAEAVRGVKRRS
ncbi:ATP-dependent helicase HrpB [Cytophagaceae bacterium ABcell3]|nr:ATP-dependent helicase HrpB [Cytophagaceae bacterium ABcell3]